MKNKTHAVFLLSLTLSAGAGFAAESVFSPDPAPVVDGDTLWVFTGHDIPGSTYFHMPDWQVFSTKDMITWTHHGVVMDTSVFKWAHQGDRAWASQAIKRGDTWYWYVAVQQEPQGDCIGVATAKSPLGPWTDPIGKPLCGPGLAWIDPSVMIDDDGKAYLFWGNGIGKPACHYAELKPNMIEIEGEIRPVPGLLDEQSFGKPKTTKDGELLTNFVEAPWIYKRGDTYYLEYAAGGIPERWAYSTAKSIHGPWTYRGEICGSAPESFTIHGGTVNFKGKDYLFYHDGTLPGGGGFRRSTCYQEIKRDADGSLPLVELKGKHLQYEIDDSTPEKKEAIRKRFFEHDAAMDVKVWPEGKVPMRREGLRPIKFLEGEYKTSNVCLTDVDDPVFTFFPACRRGCPHQGNAVADSSGAGVSPAHGGGVCLGSDATPVVVVLPGGGYFQLGWNKEGTEIAEWLNGLGISAAVLLYRVPTQRDAALCDVQRTIRILRHDAAKYGVDPKKVGVIGFSAGANLAVRTSTNWRREMYAPIDEADKISCRPDFQLAIYPWDLLERIGPSANSDWPHEWNVKEMKLGEAYPVDKETPPAFIMQAQDDFCQIETAVGYYLALRKVGVRSALHVYPSGGHGYGLRHVGQPTDVWSDAAADWLHAVLK